MIRMLMVRMISDDIVCRLMICLNMIHCMICVLIMSLVSLRTDRTMRLMSGIRFMVL